MTDKTPLGIDLLDSRYGGVFRGRPLLVSGPSRSGKTTAAFHFLRKGLRLRERCLLLTARPAADVLVEADGIGLGFADAARNGDLILLEYADDVPGRHSESQITLPPDSFLQLANVISEQAVARLVLDTCVPWVAVKSPDRLEEHVFSFIRSLDRMGVTTMLTMPKAASLASAKLYKMIEAQVPISLTFDMDSGSDHRVVIVNKYLGMDDKVGLEIPFVIESGSGIIEPVRKKVVPVEKARESVDVAVPSAAVVPPSEVMHIAPAPVAVAPVTPPVPVVPVALPTPVVAAPAPPAASAPVESSKPFGHRRATDPPVSFAASSVPDRSAADVRAPMAPPPPATASPSAATGYGGQPPWSVNQPARGGAVPPPEKSKKKDTGLRFSSHVSSGEW